MDEAARAVALVVAFAGQCSLRTGSMELVRQAGVVEDAADAVCAPAYDLAAAARALSRADDATRIQCVFALEQAATTQWQAATARQGVIRRDAERLARACGSRVPKTTIDLLSVANDLWFVVAGVGVPRDALEKAGKTLLRAGAGDERAQAVLDLVREATALAHAADVRLTVLGCGAKKLALACQDLRRVADAIPVARRAAEAARAEQGDRQRAAGDAESQQERGRRDGGDARARQGGGPLTGTWWSWLRSKTARPRAEDPEAPLIEKADSSTASAPGRSEPSQSQGNEVSSACTSMQGTALLGALTMLPYLGGPDGGGLLKADVYSYRWAVGVAFAWLWSFVGMGVPCLMVRRPILHLIARFLSRFGMLAANLLLIFYCKWSLAPDWTSSHLWVLLIITVAVHVFLLVSACYQGEL